MNGSGQTRDAMLNAYGRWFEHAHKCADCYATDKCATGQRLWDTYLNAKRGGETR